MKMSKWMIGGLSSVALATVLAVVIGKASGDVIDTACGDPVGTTVRCNAQENCDVCIGGSTEDPGYCKHNKIIKYGPAWSDYTSNPNGTCLELYDDHLCYKTCECDEADAACEGHTGNTCSATADCGDASQTTVTDMWFANGSCQGGSCVKS